MASVHPGSLLYVAHSHKIRLPYVPLSPHWWSGSAGADPAMSNSQQALVSMRGLLSSYCILPDCWVRAGCRAEAGCRTGPGCRVGCRAGADHKTGFRAVSASSPLRTCFATSQQQRLRWSTWEVPCRWNRCPKSARRRSREVLWQCSLTLLEEVALQMYTSSLHFSSSYLKSEKIPIIIFKSKMIAYIDYINSKILTM